MGVFDDLGKLFELGKDVVKEATTPGGELFSPEPERVVRKRPYKAPEAKRVDNSDAVDAEFTEVVSHAFKFTCPCGDSVHFRTGLSHLLGYLKEHARNCPHACKFLEAKP